MKRFALVFAAAAALIGADGDWIAALGGALERDPSGRITGVDLRAGWITDSDMPLLAALPHLTRLDLSRTRITDRGMQLLKDAPAIEELNLSYAEQITDEGMAAVKNWKRLKRVNLRGTKITDTTLEHLSGIEELEAIDAGFAQVTDVGLDNLASLPNLKELTIGGNKLTDMGLESLRQMPGLTYVDLSGMQRTDSGLWSVSLTELGVEVLATLRELKELRLAGTNVSARSFEKLQTLAKLERVGLQGCRRIGDDAIPLLAAYPRLQAVDLKGTAVTDAGLGSLKQAKPALRVFSGAWEGPRTSFRPE